jgi:hypothetical protein
LVPNPHRFLFPLRKINNRYDIPKALFLDEPTSQAKRFPPKLPFPNPPSPSGSLLEFSGRPIGPTQKNQKSHTLMNYQVHTCNSYIKQDTISSLLPRLNTSYLYKYYLTTWALDRSLLSFFCFVFHPRLSSITNHKRVHSLLYPFSFIGLPKQADTSPSTLGERFNTTI